MLSQQSLKVLVDYVRTSIEILLSMKLEKQHIKQIARNTSQSPVPQPKHLQGTFAKNIHSSYRHERDHAD